jgi:hypothetical protein
MMNSNEIREWATNLREHDDPNLKWDNPSELFKFIIKNWDFPGSYEDAVEIYSAMYPSPSRLICLRCDHSWYPRNPNNKPKFCPGCNSPYWNRPRRIN